MKPMTLKQHTILTLAMIAAFFLLVALIPAGAGVTSYPTNATMFIAYGPDGTVHTGITQTNQVTVSGQPNFVASTNALEIAETGADIGYTNWPAMPSVGEWAGIGVYSYSNQVVAVYQSHTRQADWTIEGTPALYGIYRGAGTEIAEWVQPTGGHDAYNTGDQVLFGGKTYESLIDGNVWSPTGYPAGWQEL